MTDLHRSPAPFSRRRLLGRAAGIAALAGAAAIAPPVALARQATPEPAAGADPLPSWNAGPLKRGIIEFVARSVDPAHEDWLPVDRRIAAFDNDGTLMAEYPMPASTSFVLDRARELVRTMPDYARDPAFAPLRDGAFDDPLNPEAPRLYLPIRKITNAGLTQQLSIAAARGWLQDAVNPADGRRWVDSAYRPMLELLALLHANDYTTFVVTGSEVDFVRAFAPEVYGIPTWRVIGTDYAYGYSAVDGRGQVTTTSQDMLNMTGPNKATAIALHVGQRPVIAVGNSDGDQQMLEYAAGGIGPSLTLMLHHTDAAREFAYDRDYPWSPFDRTLDAMPKLGFSMIDMAKDWNAVWA